MTNESVYRDVDDAFEALGIERGAHVLLHSSAKRTLKHYGTNPETLLTAFEEAAGVVGQSEKVAGTLILPTYNFTEWVMHRQFSIFDTGSECGVLTETASLKDGYLRSEHPVYSHVARGGLARIIADARNVSAYGTGSVWDIMYNWRVGPMWVVCLDVPWPKAMTAFHYVEEKEQVPYKHYKAFEGAWFGPGAAGERRQYFMYVRNVLDGVVTNVDGIEDRFVVEGHARRVYLPGTDIPLTAVPLPTFVEHVTRMIRDEPTALYDVDHEKAARVGMPPGRDE